MEMMVPASPPAHPNPPAKAINHLQSPRPPGSTGHVSVPISIHRSSEPHRSALVHVEIGTGMGHPHLPSHRLPEQPEGEILAKLS